jgi:hypothetical protein
MAGLLQGLSNRGYREIPDSGPSPRGLRFVPPLPPSLYLAVQESFRNPRDGSSFILLAFQDVPMFRVEPTQGDQWRIVDENDNTVFVGTMREAEEWLDCRDNAFRQTATAGGWLRNSVNSVKRFFARLSAARAARPTFPGSAADLRRPARDQ